MHCLILQVFCSYDFCSVFHVLWIQNCVSHLAHFLGTCYIWCTYLLNFIIFLTNFVAHFFVFYNFFIYVIFVAKFPFLFYAFFIVSAIYTWKSIHNFSCLESNDRNIYMAFMNIVWDLFMLTQGSSLDFLVLFIFNISRYFCYNFCSLFYFCIPHFFLLFVTFALFCKILVQFIPQITHARFQYFMFF